MAKSAERFLAEALDQAIRARGGYGATRLAEQLAVCVRTVHRWCSGETVPTGADVVRILAAIFAGEPARATALAAALLPASRADAVNASVVLGQACDVVEDAAQLQHVVREATGDGVLTPLEDVAIRTAALRVQRHAAAVPASLASLPSAQLAIGELR